MHSSRVRGGLYLHPGACAWYLAFESGRCTDGLCMARCSFRREGEIVHVIQNPSEKDDPQAQTACAQSQPEGRSEARGPEQRDFVPAVKLARGAAVRHTPCGPASSGNKAPPAAIPVTASLPRNLLPIQRCPCSRAQAGAPVCRRKRPCDRKCHQRRTAPAASRFANIHDFLNRL